MDWWRRWRNSGLRDQAAEGYTAPRRWPVAAGDISSGAMAAIQPGEPAGLLFQRREVAQPPVRVELGQSARRHHLHLYLVVAAVAMRIGGRVAEHIAIAQFHSDLGGDIVPLVE